MRTWRNWQTRTFEGRMGDRPSSSLGARTTKDLMVGPFFFYLAIKQGFLGFASWSLYKMNF